MVKDPADYVIDHDRGIVFVTLTGQVRPAHLAAMQDRARRDKDFDPGRAVLLDIRDADLSALTPEDIRRLAQSSPAAKAAPRAVVVQDAVQGWLARLFQTFMELAGKNRLQVFTDHDAAVAWLIGHQAAEEAAESVTQPN